MSMVEVKTADLIGDALDWAVAQVVKPEGFVLRDATGELGCWVIGIAYNADDPESWMKSNYSPSTEWIHGGPLISEHQLEIVQSGNGWSGVKSWCYGEPYEWYPVGETHLIAACLAIVMKASGDTVQVPEELTGTRELPGANSP